MLPSVLCPGGKDVLADVLDNLQMALQESGDLLSLAPVPGLAPAVGLLSKILEQVKKMQSNAETVEAVSKDIGSLNDVIDKVARQVESRATRLQTKLEDMLKGFQDSDGWRERVGLLRKELEELLAKAVPCAKGPWYKRLFRSNRDEETLKTIRDDLASAIQRFQLAGGLSIETLAEETLAVGEATSKEVQRVAKAQEEERVREVIDRIPHADAAGFRVESNSGKTEFLSGSRQAVFKRLDEWVLSDKPICFLIGVAGMGKSTIASEFCRRHEDEVGASFFFKRGDPSVGSTAVFFSTIAYQLAQLRPELRPHIARAAQSHAQMGVRQQMQYMVAELLQKPLQDAEAAGVRSRVYIVVDALDECEEKLVPECIGLLVSCALQHSSSLRLLITSRPAPDYVDKALQQDSTLKESSTLLSLRAIEEREAVDRDITDLIRARLGADAEAKQWCESDPSVVSQLTRQSDGVFVYARTAVDFIIGGAGSADMKERLVLILAPGNTYGLGNMDSLYRTVLETAFPPAHLYPKARDHLHLVLAWIALGQKSDGIAPSEVQDLSGLSCDESIPILRKLSSVIIFDPGREDVKTRRFRAMHVTFRDFLVAHERCKDDYYVDPPQTHARLATACLRWKHTSKRYDHPTNAYTTDHWLRHLLQASCTDELAGLLKDSYSALRQRIGPHFSFVKAGDTALTPR